MPLQMLLLMLLRLWVLLLPLQLPALLTYLEARTLILIW